MDRSNLIKYYFRFLKDNGIYNRVINQYAKNKQKNGIITALSGTDPYNFISSTNVFGPWHVQKEGEIFWWAISCMWIYRLLFYNGEDAYKFVNFNQDANLLMSIKMIKLRKDYHKLPLKITNEIYAIELYYKNIRKV